MKKAEGQERDHNYVNHINVNMGKQDNYIMISVKFWYSMFWLGRIEDKWNIKVNLSYKEMDM